MKETGAQNHDAVRIGREHLGDAVHRLCDGGGAGFADDVAAQRSGDVEAAADGRESEEAVAAREGHEEAAGHGIRRAEHTVDHADDRHDDDFKERECNERFAALAAIDEIGDGSQRNGDGRDDQVDQPNRHSHSPLARRNAMHLAIGRCRVSSRANYRRRLPV